MKPILLGFVLCLSQPAMAQTTPFGFREGTSIAELRRLGAKPVEGPQGVWTVATAPQSHPSFEAYLLLADDSTGLCKVVATGVTVETSVYGTELRIAFDRIEEAITEKYRQGSRSDFLRAGSIWDEPNDWMMAIRQKERVLATYWENPAPDVRVIMLQANALSANRGWVSLHYEFANFPACKKRIDAAERRVF
jgi:hypothetical protein